MIQTMSAGSWRLCRSFRGAKLAERATSLNSDENCEVDRNKYYWLNTPANYYEEIELQFEIMHFSGQRLSIIVGLFHEYVF